MTLPVEVKGKAALVSGDTWSSFRQEMERMFERFSDGFEFPSFRNLEHFWPRSMEGFARLAVDASETDKAYNITAEMPGLSEKDVDVSVSNGVLTIKGEKHEEKEEKGKNQYISERSYGAFQRSFALPDDVNVDAIVAKTEKGVLTVTIPKSPKAQNGKKIEVKAA